MAVLIGTTATAALTLSAFKSGPGRQQASVRADDTSRPSKTGSGGRARSFLLNRSSLSTAGRRSCNDARAGRAYYLTTAEHWAHKMGAVFRRSHEHARNCVRQRELAAVAHRKAHVYRQRYRAWKKAQVSAVAGHVQMWLCIHRHEGDWNDGGSPYYGGLQMGWWFMSSYGSELLRSKGTADNWSPQEQMGVAERGYRQSNYSTSWLFSQWPNTAPPCV